LRCGLIFCSLQTLGLEKGWGNTAGRVLETIKLLQDLLQAPDPETLEKFLALIPMVFSVVIVSPHGYFGQAGVLGLPDTGGQVKENPCCILSRSYRYTNQIKKLCSSARFGMSTLGFIQNALDWTQRVSALGWNRLFISWTKCGHLRMRSLKSLSYKDWTSNLRLLW